MKKAHLLFGICGVIAFLATGVYMKLSFPAAYVGNEVAHMMFRANHIYLLFSALLNVVLGLYLTAPVQRFASLLQTVASLLLLLCTVIFFAAFWLEAAPADFERPLIFSGVVLTVVAVAALAFSMLISPLLAKRKE